LKNLQAASESESNDHISDALKASVTRLSSDLKVPHLAKLNAD